MLLVQVFQVEVLLLLALLLVQEMLALVMVCHLDLKSY
jgi:hypothetical protein